MITKEKLEEILELVNKQHHAHGYRSLQSEDSGVAIAAIIAAEASDRQAEALSKIASALGKLADGGISVNVDVNTESFAEAIAEATANVTVTIKDLVKISNAITNMATGIENLNIENIINIGDTAKKLQATAKELEGTARKLEATERGS